VKATGAIRHRLVAGGTWVRYGWLALAILVAVVLLVSSLGAPGAPSGTAPVGVVGGRAGLPRGLGGAGHVTGRLQATVGTGHDATRSTRRIAFVLQLGSAAHHPGHGTVLAEEA
jgi:hypothetical protein